MNFNIQPTLKSDIITLCPLLPEDFENLYNVSSDPAIWASHPNKNRWKREVFQTFFEGAIQSGGAFKIVHQTSGKIIGSTRFYDYNPEDNSILIGYTFFSTSHWGKGFNHTVKKLMLDYIFKFVSKVIFHIGASNLRSQRSIIRLGPEKISEEVVTYYGETPKLNHVYEISREKWNQISFN